MYLVYVSVCHSGIGGQEVGEDDERFSYGDHLDELDNFCTPIREGN